jgi:heat shock protein HslJ
MPLMLLVPRTMAAPAAVTTDEPAIPPVVWELAGFAEPDRAPVTIDDPSRYTVQFLPEGVLVARFDCNEGRGGYTAADGGLAVGPMAATTAMCPPDSHGPTFQRLLAQATSYRFEPEQGHLVLRGEAGVLDLQPTLPGVVWQWQETVRNSGELTLRPDQPAHYTVKFLPDGTLAVRADCNNAVGTYNIAGSQIDLQIGGVTRVACPPSSLADPFLAELDRAISYYIGQGNLALALAGGGVMRHTPVVTASPTAIPPPGRAGTTAP